MKYLETNSLRKYASRLIDENFVSDKYTSILSILELISGIKDDRSFSIRKSILTKVLNSQIEIDTSFPELKILQAFGIDVNNDDLVGGISKINQIILSVDNYENLLLSIKQNSIYEIWYFLKQYDKTAEVVFKKIIADQYPESGIKEKIDSFNNRWTQPNIAKLKPIILKIFYNYAKNYLANKNKLSNFDLYNNYDNSMDIYLISVAYYIDQKESTKSIPGKNDYLDLNHLIYLCNTHNQIITDDKLLFKLLNKLYPNNILKTNHF